MTTAGIDLEYDEITPTRNPLRDVHNPKRNTDIPLNHTPIQAIT